MGEAIQAMRYLSGKLGHLNVRCPEQLLEDFRIKAGRDGFVPSDAIRALIVLYCLGQIQLSDAAASASGTARTEPTPRRPAK
jgi:hypothetical protein